MSELRKLLGLDVVTDPRMPQGRIGIVGPVAAGPLTEQKITDAMAVIVNAATPKEGHPS